jgi:hypothetical protein
MTSDTSHGLNSWYTRNDLALSAHRGANCITRYTTIATLIAALNEQVIAPAEAKAAELQRQRTRPIDGLP